MTDIIWHGRGGQGAFTASRIFGAAYSLTGENKFALAFPTFGPERRGAPIKAFTKLDDKIIGNRTQIEKADYSVFLDDTLFDESSFFDLKENGKIIINTKKNFDDSRIIAFDGDSLALSVLKMPVVNTVMLGILAKESGLVSKDEVETGIKNTMSEKLHNKNIEIIESIFRG